MQETRSGGIGCFGVLLIVFVTLKLSGLVTWSWWFVLLPLYGPIGLFVACVLLWLAMQGIHSIRGK